MISGLSRCRRLVIGLVWSLVIMPGVSSTPQWNGTVDANSLPDIMIAYGALLSSDPAAGPKDIAARIEAAPAMAKLSSELDQLGVRVPECLLFSHESFIVQTAFERQSYGFPRHEHSGTADTEIPSTNLLFVSTPIAKLDGKILVVLSCVRPEKVKVFTLDSKLHPELLYDTDRVPATRDGVFVAPLTSVFQITVIGNAQFLLRERVSKSVPPKMVVPSRSFLFDIRDGKPEIAPMKVARQDAKP